MSREACGEIIFYPEGNMVNSYARGLGAQIYNEVIQKMKSQYKNGSPSCKRIYERIYQLSLTPQALFYHILMENNGPADKLANLGARSSQGIVEYRNQTKTHKYVPWTT